MICVRENSPSKGKEEFGDNVFTSHSGRFYITHSLISVWVECNVRDVLFLKRKRKYVNT